MWSWLPLHYINKNRNEKEWRKYQVSKFYYSAWSEKEKPQAERKQVKNIGDDYQNN